MSVKLIGRQDAVASFDPHNVDLNTADAVQIVCYLNAGQNEYDGRLGARISAIFVILVVSSAVTFFPVLAARSEKVRVPLYVYLFARYFGTGVIVATAFIHLLDPAYAEIGPNTCVGMTGGWAGYPWPPAIALASGMFVFLMDFAAERYVEKKYGWAHGVDDNRQSSRATTAGEANTRRRGEKRQPTHQTLHSGDQNCSLENAHDYRTPTSDRLDTQLSSLDVDADDKELQIERSFKQQIAAFLILEFGVIFHSVIIGLTLGSAGDEFPVLYPVIVFHQSFEGLGIGSRLSAIPFPKHLGWMPWVLCAAYGLTTPIALAIGLGVRTTYNESSNTANIVSGVLDSVSAGILIYTGFVELLARDFLFNPQRTRNDLQLAFMVASVMVGAGVMALLGKWA